MRDEPTFAAPGEGQDRLQNMVLELMLTDDAPDLWSTREPRARGRRRRRVCDRRRDRRIARDWSDPRSRRVCVPDPCSRDLPAPRAAGVSMSTNRGPGGLAVMAAIDRAERHNPINPGTPVWEILEHLDIPRRTRRARQTKARLTELTEEGLLDHFRRGSIPVWELTARGRQQLIRAQRRGRVPVLPESPQHKTWRHARALAGQKLIPARFVVGEALVDAFFLLDMSPASHSDVWFELAERLKAASYQFGSINHCLYEWPEPTDEHPDIDSLAEASDQELAPDEQATLRDRRRARRNTQSWDIPNPPAA